MIFYYDLFIKFRRMEKIMKKVWILVLIIFFIFTLTSCAQDISKITKKVKDLKLDIYKIKGIITKIYFLDTDKIYLYELSSEKEENSITLMVSNSKYRRGDKIDIVAEAFRLELKSYEQDKQDYWTILKNYIMKKTLLSNTEIILLVKKIDIIVYEYLKKLETITIFLESHQDTMQE